MSSELARRRPADVVDPRGFEVVAVAERSEHGGGKRLLVKMRQRTLAGLADPARRADGIDDIGFGHDAIPSFGERDLTGSHADRAVEADGLAVELGVADNLHRKDSIFL